MRLVLVDNLLVYDGPYLDQITVTPHLGLMSLVAAARTGGHEALIFDPKHHILEQRLPRGKGLFEQLARKILTFDPDVVGFTALGCNFICPAKVAAHLKRFRPDLPILIGGPHATILHREIIAGFPQFDVVMRHEAEETLPPLLDHLSRGLGSARFDVRGVTYRAEGDIAVTGDPPLIEDLDTLPFPAFDAYPIRDLGMDRFYVEAGRGCPFECTFCSTAPFFKRRYRLKSPERICAEMDFLNAEYGFREFGLNHDLFTVNRKKVMAFCDEVAPRNYRWSCSARIDCVDDELIARMRDAGCDGIYFGIETGSPRMQRITRKKLDLDLVEPILNLVYGAGIRATLSFITGFPDETVEDQLQTLTMMDRCLAGAPADIDVTLQLHLLTPEPGTPITDENFDKLLYDGYISEFNFGAIEPDDASIMENNPAVFMTHHFLPTLIPRRHNVFVSAIVRTASMLGNKPLRYILSRSGKNLPDWIADIEAWHAAEPHGTPVDGTLLERYLAATWGSDHHLVALTRYINAGLRTAGTAPPPPLPLDAADQRRVTYIVNPRAQLLESLPDCGSMIAGLDFALQSGTELPASASRDDYLVIRNDEVELYNYKVSPEIKFMLRLFASPRDIAGAKTTYARMTSLDMPDDALRRLVQINAIIPLQTSPDILRWF